MNRKLGKLAPRIDVRTLKLARYLKLGELPPLMDAVSNSVAVKQDWGEMLNDALGDCTCAAMGHVVMMLSAQAGKIVVPSDDEVLSMYKAISGYDGREVTDNGAVELDALKFMMKTGLSGFRLDAFADVDPKDIVHVKYCIQLFGSCYIGVMMPQSAMDDLDAGKPWANASDESFTGGHAIPLVDYDESGPVCVTWGQLQPMTWDWFTRYCDEAHAPLFLAGCPRSGIDLPALERDLKVVQSD